MTALAPSSTLIAPVPLASSPVLPLFATTTLFSMVTFWASMSSMPWTRSQLITAPRLVTGTVRVMLPPSSVSWPPGHCDRSGPVLVGPGQPQAAGLAHSSGPPWWQKAGSGRGLGVAGAVGEGVTGLRVVASAAGATATAEVFAGARCEHAAMDNTTP